MAFLVYHVALSFADGKHGPTALEAFYCLSATAAITRAELLSQKEGRIGAMAFSRTGDPVSGEFGDAVVLQKFGVVGDII